MRRIIRKKPFFSLLLFTLQLSAPMVSCGCTACTYVRMWNSQRRVSRKYPLDKNDINSGVITESKEEGTEKKSQLFTKCEWRRWTTFLTRETKNAQLKNHKGTVLMAKRRFRAQVHYFSFSFFCRFCKPRIQISRRHLFYSVECRINFLLLLISGKSGENQCFLPRDSCTTLFFSLFFLW